MKYLTHLALLSSTLLLIGCGDTYDSDNKQYNEKPSSPKGAISTLDREAKYLTDLDGRALYTFDADGLNMRNCGTDCQKNWPLFTGSNTESEEIAVIPDDEESQLTYRKHPLYYYTYDDTGIDLVDPQGDKVAKWHLIFAVDGTNDSQTQFSNATRKQTYLTDGNGRALYTFDKDTNNTSNCYNVEGNDCETIWPIFHTTDFENLPDGVEASDFDTITRDPARAIDGVTVPQQTTYKGQPLYYFAPDNNQSGETKGDWVKGVWHLVELDTSAFTDTAVAAGKTVFTNPEKCASCHGEDGQRKPNQVDNIIARYGDAELIKDKLIDMRDNDNPQGRSGIMVAIAQGEPLKNNQLIINLSAFVATLKK